MPNVYINAPGQTSTEAGIDTYNVGGGAIGSGTEAIRQAMVLGDSATQAAVAKVQNAQPATTDYGLTVRPATPEPNTAVTTVAWTNATAQNTALTLTGLAGYGTALVEFWETDSGTAVLNAGVLTFEIDAGSAQWFPVSAVRSSNYIADTTYTVTGGKQLWQIELAGATSCRVRLSTVLAQGAGTGTATANLRGQATVTASDATVVVGQPTAANLNVTATGTVAATQSGSWSLAANQSVNVAQVNGSTVSTAATGVQKVGLVGNAGAAVDGTVGAGTAPANMVVAGSVYNTSAPAPTAGQSMAQQVDQAGNSRVAPGIALTTLSAWNSGTSLNATQTVFTNSGAPAVLVQLVQTTTLTAGAVTVEVSYDGTNWVTATASQILDPTSATLAQIAIPYTVQASTNKPFLILTHGAQGLRLKLSTQITGTGSVTPNYALLPEAPVKEVVAFSPTAANFNATVQPGNTANTTPWLEKLHDGTNALGTFDTGARVNSLPVVVVPSSTANGLTASRIKSAASTNATNLKGSAGQVFGWALFNDSAASKYFKLYNKATAPTIGTDTPLFTIIVPSGGGTNVEFTHGIPFGTGIGYGITGAIADSNSTAVAADDIHGVLLWR